MEARLMGVWLSEPLTPTQEKLLMVFQPLCGRTKLNSSCCSKKVHVWCTAKTHLASLRFCRKQVQKLPVGPEACLP